MEKSLITSINDKTIEEVNRINNQYSSELEKLKEQLKNEYQQKRIEATKEELRKSKQLILNANNEKLVELKEQKDTLKRKLLDEIYIDSLKAIISHVDSLDNKGLLNFVYTLVSKENLKGNEVIRVSKNDYDKYLKALSTKPKQNLVELDLLNKKLGDKFKIHLSTDNFITKGGFLVVGDDFDLNFDFNLLVDRLIQKMEKELIKELL